jgi:hypothetical protein
VPLGLVGVAGRDQALDHGDDLADMRGRRGLDVRRRDAQRGHVLAVGGGEAVGDGRDRHAALARSGVDLVVHVGDVARIFQRAVAPPQQVGQDPEHRVWPGVADMDVVVDRRSADVHRGATGVERRERLEPPRQAVVQVQAHRAGRFE